MKKLLFALIFCMPFSLLFAQEENVQKADSQNALNALPCEECGGGGGGGDNISLESYTIQVVDASTIRLIATILTSYGASTVFTCSLKVNNVTLTTTATNAQLSSGVNYTITSASLVPFNNYMTEVTIKYGSTTSGTDDILRNFQFAAPEPSAQATNIGFNTITTSSMNVTWTAASGPPAGYIVLRSTASPNTAPSDGTVYSIGNALGNSTVVYVGSGTSFSSTSLSSNTTYYYAIYAYNGSGTITNYRTTSPLTGSQATPAAEPTNQPTNITFSSVSLTGLTVNWTAASPAVNGYLVIRKTNGVPTGAPTDFTTYVVGNTIGDGTVVYVGSGTSVGQTGLTANTRYGYAVFAYNGSGAGTNYKTATPLTGLGSTLATEPVAQPTYMTFPIVTETSIKVQWEFSGTADGFLVVMKAGSAPTALPSDGTEYNTGETIGDAIVVGNTGLAYEGDSQTKSVEPGGGNPTYAMVALSLSSNVNYFFKIFSFNGGLYTGSSNYLTTNPLSGSQYTIASQPGAQPTGLNFSSITPVGMTLGWTAASGSPNGYIVLRRAGAAPTGVPADGATYTAGSVIGDGTVAYVGSGTSFAESGLASNTTYYYSIFSYNGVSANFNYLTTSSLSGNNTTMASEPTAQAPTISFTSITTNSMIVNWTAASPAPSGYLVVRTTSTSADPADGTTYVAGSSTLGNGTVVYIGSGTSFTSSGLSAGTTYTYKIYSYNGSGSTINYLIASPTTGNRVTLSNEPSAQPTNLVISQVTSSSMTLNWTAPATAPTGYLILRRGGTVPTEVPVDGTTYGSTFGASQVFMVTGTSTNFTGLIDYTNHHYKIWAYNGSGASINYNTVSPLSGNQFTLVAPPPAPTGIEFSYIGSDRMNVGWTQGATAPAGYLILRRAGGPPGQPVQGTAYTEGQSIGSDGTIVDFSGNIQMYMQEAVRTGAAEPCTECGGGGGGVVELYVTSTGMQPSTAYYFAIYAYNSPGTGTSYSSGLTGNATTLQADPAAVSNFTVSPLTQSSVSISWSAVSGATGYIVIRQTSVTTAKPIDGIVYGSPGTAAGGTVAYVGNGLTCTDNGLASSTTYYYYIFAYNGSAATTNYGNGVYVPYTTPEGKNYITSQIFLRPGVLDTHVDTLNDVFIQQSSAFSDGMGRLVQSIAKRASPSKNDIVTAVEYDLYGRQSKSYLPFVSINGAGVFRSFSIDSSLAFYQKGLNGIPVSAKPYSLTKFENSPLNRVIEQGAPGETWQPNVGDYNGHTIKNWTSGNTTNSVRLWKTDGTGTGYYAANEIIVQQTVDENGQSAYTYVDKSERTVMKKSIKSSTDVITHYVYDDFGNLKFIIPPEAHAAMQTSGTWNINSNNIKTLWCTEFWYDNENRLIKKKIPEADTIFTVYDKLGRVALTQDGKLRTDNKWMFTKYDIMGRPVLTGVYSHGSAVGFQAMQDLVLADPDVYETRSSTNYSVQLGYTNNVYPNIANCEIWTANYYDDYNFDYTGGDDYTYTSDTDFSGNTPFYRLKGKLTGTKTRILLTQQQPYAGYNQANHSEANVVLKDQMQSSGTIAAKEIALEGEVVLSGEMVLEAKQDAAGNQSKQEKAFTAAVISQTWLTAVSFYDKYGRVIYTISDNSMGGTDKSYTEYDFPGKVLKTKTIHQTTATTVTVKKRFDYDHAGRLLKTYQQNNSDSEILLAQNQYNQLGTLIEKDLHSTNGGSTFLQAVNYTYNIRGWMTKVNDPSNLGTDLFGMELKYETINSNLTGSAQYNGNISQQIWKTGSTTSGFGYTYDPLNQLTAAIYESGVNFDTDYDKYSEKNITYDLNGNIKTLQRYSSSLTDNLTMTLSGNKLIGSDDAVVNSAMASDFEDRGSTYSGSNIEYTYDVNGNMTVDKNKGITSITYNYLNLPITVNFGATKRIDWTYTATGVKLQKKVYDNGLILTIDYVSGFVYKNETLDFFSTEAGRVKKLAGGSLQYQYNLSDQLNNTRVLFADNNSDGFADVVEEFHYYAFGMKIEGLSTLNPDNKFMYNGKELVDNFGLNWYEYGWRMYDAQLGRWHEVDPIDEFYSPYCYVGNNPIMFIDPDGTSYEYNVDAEGNATRISDKGGADVDYFNFIDGDLKGYSLIVDHVKEQVILQFPNFSEPLKEIVKNVGADPWGASGKFYAYASSLDAAQQKATFEGRNRATSLDYEATKDGAAELLSLVAGGEVLVFIKELGFSVKVMRYVNSSGFGINLYKKGERLLGLDWHKFKLGGKVTGKIVNLPHIDLDKLGVKHWPWKQMDQWMRGVKK
ncbi:fibronectin type III domain-containing protein [bacterium]|nr:fibronectin type III domain-containing protein [bacterium]